MYLATYVSRYGSGVDYPTLQAPAAAPGRPAPAGPNGAFWSHLWLLPSPAGTPTRRAVSARPGEDSLYACKVRAGTAGPGTLDYAGPDLTQTAFFPGSRLSDRVASQTWIGGDLLLPGDCNHGGDHLGPNFAFNALALDGTVRTVQPNSVEHARYLMETNAENGVRGR